MKKIIFMILVLSVFVIPVMADSMSSTSYVVQMQVNEAGGEASSTTYRITMEMGRLFSMSESSTYRVCMGMLCMKFGYQPGGSYVVPSVQFMLESDISGAAGDVAYVDTQTASGKYAPTSLNNYVACIEDPVLSNDPVIGIVYAGNALKYIKMDSGTVYKITMSQEAQGNKFVVPVTSGGCNLVVSKYTGQIPTSPYSPVPEIKNVIELILNYPINIIGDFEKTGSFSINLGTSQTNITGEPV